MKRRDFLKTSSAAAVAAALPWRGAHAQADWRSFEITTRADIDRPQGVSRAWIPLPLTQDLDWQRNFGSSWTGNAARTQVMHDGRPDRTSRSSRSPAASRRATAPSTCPNLSPTARA